MFAAGSGGQSKLVLPKSGLVPFTVHALPAFGPAPHVDVVPKAPVPQIGHGLASVGPVKTREMSGASFTESPPLTSTVPVTAPVTWLTTHTETPPEDSGSGAPKKKEQTPRPVQSVSVVHCTEVSPVQRWLFAAVPPAFGAGPLTVATVPAQPVAFTVRRPLLMTWLSCDWPVQPLSRSAASPLARKVIWVGHAPPTVVEVGCGVGTSVTVGTPAVAVGAPAVGVGPPAVGVGPPAVGVGAAAVDVGAAAVDVGAPAVEVGAAAGEFPWNFYALPYEVNVTTSFWGTLPELHEVIAMARQGLIKPHVQRFCLKEAMHAYELMEQGKLSGRAVIVP